MVEIRTVTPRWQLGPEHPDYEASGPYSYVMLRPERHVRNTNGKRGSNMARRFLPTPEGAAVMSRRDTSADAGAVSRDAYPGAAVPSGPHAYCPPVLGCQDGRLPAGWVREGAAS